GLQFSFGLQQGNMSPIYSYLGAEEKSLAVLSLAGPITGLVVQPIVGALSDKTTSRWGRRTPYFIIGAIMCSLGLFFMPFSSSILMAASLLWILDAGNNMTMEPYRAYVSDRLEPEQRQLGFLTQSAFTGLAQMLAFLSPSIMVYALGMNLHAVDEHNIPYVTRYAFMIGAFLSLFTILWSIIRVPELPLTEEEKAAIAAKPKGFLVVFKEIWDAIWEMPIAMRKLALMSLFQWYAMGCYWGYIVYSIGRSVFNTSDPTADGFRSAVLANGEMAAFYNGLGFLLAFGMVPLSKRFGANRVHALCLVLAGMGMIALTFTTEKWMLFIPAIGVGIGWASIMGNPYVILANAIPPDRTGIYMGIFNMMIVTPMILIAATLPFYYEPLIGGDPRNVLRLAGVLMFLAAAAVWWVKTETATAGGAARYNIDDQ
ncbi:MAG: MFS transporter, partial [Caulobacterales bacterium]|nr:MFS transporter [Caulobacterales bacterium]